MQELYKKKKNTLVLFNFSRIGNKILAIEISADKIRSLKDKMNHQWSPNGTYLMGTTNYKKL